MTAQQHYHLRESLLPLPPSPWNFGAPRGHPNPALGFVRRPGSGFGFGFDVQVQVVYEGRAYSCDSVWQHDRVEIIANDQGNKTTSSVGAFTDTESLIGDTAKNQVAMNPRPRLAPPQRLSSTRALCSAPPTPRRRRPL
ncbi:unnamed protein product [Malus baccata var. baccata]